ncbi:copper chaperone CopZ [Mesoflavibacter sabulilitoris]|uniref:Heavy metal transporter n=1 Tax=Mesoflavibacter zeaxanthinifaciens subsp. sabulilitoris TaxID=1520893 RepID=A0A2T1NF58_9FLAO|nr:heavy-metal-associated domain-containing protein [Mesoflavibacter zeaxanthinifaciens]MBB3124836.1 copper chaperone CopZ [Mesoflavibacter zeaxanthinifaciens subsp. sabulilitoris]MCP4053091.1 heavy-metal-associated domain-containing protein [Mesoflavibacter sp.]PSG91073.1 heavy metal transporter [Mesoflavibacter zeaxanthinifaciens subsp. sabulilitoris]
MKTSIIVQNLKCGGCANTISTKLSEIETISNILVDVEESKVTFNVSNSEDAIEVKQKLKSLGYPSIEDENGLVSKAKSFVSCATGKLSK